jgi:hypothetical protein
MRALAIGDFLLYRPSHLNSFGHLVPWSEFWMFTLLGTTAPRLRGADVSGQGWPS